MMPKGIPRMVPSEMNRYDGGDSPDGPGRVEQHGPLEQGHRGERGHERRHAQADDEQAVDRARCRPEDDQHERHEHGVDPLVHAVEPRGERAEQGEHRPDGEIDPSRDHDDGLAEGGEAEPDGLDHEHVAQVLDPQEQGGCDDAEYEEHPEDQPHQHAGLGEPPIPRPPPGGRSRR